MGNKRDIVFFPKNFALLRVLDKKRRDFTGTSDTSLKMPYLLKPDYKSSFQNDKNFGNFGNFEGRRSNNFANPENPDFCKEHNKKFEIICIDHRQKICVNCALFGSHKNHNIKSEEEVLREITLRADKILELFQGIEDLSSDIFQPNVTEENVSALYDNFIKKFERITKAITDKFNVKLIKPLLFS